ncbi:uncharacterized protein K460DRAFT_372525 [Cucurbitaria berberidis CBS 394.84]|uniref:Transmembrane protein n=1 Tax=Cucurbitaria berberidis CBS 394.84 TaxID=1168544 RepID=A0A9P4GRV6_9PLEO|nr:uncharacterized protein K460DRAFT_372525 [Cucurbitaria berberidis CBS 394.84]KAF1850210.1 hypothetical protein K460DRAFT_372525 [Cucurbitaria berberidis CBS 394.84]
MSRALLFSFLLPLLALAQSSPAQSSLPPAGYNGGTDNPQDPSDAGAEGAQKGAFSLSKGALAAIIVVAVIVVIGGIGSATLFWLAKKRQWDVRQSIRRASRRLTGRATTDVSKQNRNNRRTGIRLNSPPPGKNAGSKPKQEHDLEKGFPMSNKQPKTTTTITSVKK